MTKADRIFIDTCNEILNQPDSNMQETRACWVESDGSKTPAKTKHIFGVCNKYDLSEGSEFPILSIRQTYWKKALDEIIWIYVKKSNSLKDLNSHIWDSWADELGSIGRAYGYQCGKKYIQPDISLKENKTVLMDQVDRAIYDLKHDPTSRRIMINMWNVEDLPYMNLQPCAYSLTLNVCNGKLNGLLNQRSQDMLTASNWNVVQYSFLMMMISQVVEIPLGELVHVVGDCHIYDRHIPLVKKLIEDNTINSIQAPIIGKDVRISKLPKTLEEFTIDYFEVNNYEYKKTDFKIPVAV